MLENILREGHPVMKRGYVSALLPLSAILGATAIIGLLLPSVLVSLGFPPLLVAMFTFALFAILIDGAITKIGQTHAVHEMNPIISYLGKWIGINRALVLTRSVEVGILLYGLVILQSVYMLLAFAWLFFMLIFISILSMLTSQLVTNREIRQQTNQA
ncbi:MAG: hypothetical protein ACHQ03_10470 [Candidatus Bathyarchaeia archaeon]